MRPLSMQTLPQKTRTVKPAVREFGGFVYGVLVGFIVGFAVVGYLVMAGHTFGGLQ